MGTHNIAKMVYQLLTFPVIAVGRLFIILNILNTKSHFKCICKSIDSNNDIDPPEVLVHALIIAEDKRFWNHRGVDFYAILRAIYRRYTLNKIEGASTIEQQLVRVIIGDYRICLKRKLIEIILATVVAHKYNKYRLANTYLNLAYYGPGLQGYLSVCSRFNISQNSIGTKEASFISAAIRRPIPRQCTGQWIRLHLARCNWIYSILIHLHELPNPNSACINFRSLSTSRFLDSAHRFGAGRIG